MKTVVRTAWVAVIIGLISFGLTFRDRFQPQGAGEVLDHTWVDHVPHSEREPFRIVMFSHQEDEDGNPFGAYVRFDSVYKLCIEFFNHQVDDKEIRYTFLHDNVKAVTKYKVEKIAPDKDDLDWKLTLEKDPRNNLKQSVFYTSSTWNSRNLPGFIRHALPADLTAR